jgi:anaphase-promoting complex subunit 2
MIVRGIMSETLRVPLSPDEQDLTELSEELSNGLPRATALGGLEELDYDDMNWVPDPVDAGPEFRRSKGLDVVGSLISLWENKEVWIKEIQGVLADRLLQDPKYDFKKEMHTVELLKLRFGETATQCLDVMLKDVRDSKRCDAVILEMRPTSQQNSPEFHAKILSRFYWPPPREKNVLIEHFKLPAVLAQLMRIYQIGFEALKKKRKLEWIITAGVCAVELELEDRIVSVPDATPAQAAVIYAFQDNTQNYHVDGPKSLTVEQLQKQTLMREALLNKCLLFWVEKGVLVESLPNVYTVLEFAGSRAGSPVGRPPVVAIQDLAQLDEEKENERKVVEQFVVGMLTNGGIMPTERIFMMLGMLVPGGFRWSTEELGEFLNGMKERGKVEPVAGGWKVVT